MAMKVLVLWQFFIKFYLDLEIIIKSKSSLMAYEDTEPYDTDSVTSMCPCS